MGMTAVIVAPAAITARLREAGRKNVQTPATIKFFHRKFDFFDLVAAAVPGAPASFGVVTVRAGNAQPPTRFRSALRTSGSCSERHVAVFVRQQTAVRNGSARQVPRQILDDVRRL